MESSGDHVRAEEQTLSTEVSPLLVPLEGLAMRYEGPSANANAGSSVKTAPAEQHT